MPAAESQLDLARLTELEGLLGTDREAIVATLMTQLTTELGHIHDGLESGDLHAVAAAAHAARNSALMIDARPALQVLKELETSARSGQAEAASAASARLGQVWPRLRRELERAAEPRA